MKIKMLKTRQGSEDGFIIHNYVKGNEYDLADTLATHFLRNGWAFNNEPIKDEWFNLADYVSKPITNPQTYKDIGEPL